MAAHANAPAQDAARPAARPRRRRAGLLGGLALALLDLAVYVKYALTARPAPCTAPGPGVRLLGCFWPELGASFAALPWLYLGLTLAVPLVVALLSATRDASVANGERGAVTGSAVGLFASGFEALLVVAVVIYEIIAASVGGSACPPGERCIDVTAIPGAVQLILLVLALIVGGILLLRLLGGAALGALGGWLGAHLPGQRRIATTPTGG